jgi:hypothetical protein
MAADPQETCDPVIAVYLEDVDRTLLRSNLRLSPEARIRKLQDFVRLMLTLRDAGRRKTEQHRRSVAACEDKGEESGDGH